MVRIMKKDGNRLEGIGERIDVRLTLIEEALGMTPGDPEIYGNWIASKAPEPEVGEEEVGVIEGMDAVEDATTCFPRTEDGVPFCWDYQIKGFFKDACSSLRRVPGTRSSKLTAFKKVIDGTVFVEQEAGSYDKTGGIGLAPLIAVAGASSVACLTLVHRLGKGDDDEKTIA